MNKVVPAVAAALLPVVAGATDPVAIGYITDLSYRGGYYIFRITNGSTNSCAPCPADPGGMQAGQFCWIPETQTAKPPCCCQRTPKADAWRVASWESPAIARCIK